MCNCADCQGNLSPEGCSDGVGIVSTVQNANSSVTLIYSDGSSFTTGQLIGPQGIQGTQGIQGEVGPTGPTGATGATGPEGPVGPIGVMMPWAGTSSTPPTGWLFCEGGSYNKVTYAALFNVIGYTYGGSGSNFNMPDMRDRVPVGKSSSATPYDLTSVGNTGGDKTVALTKSEIPAHKHSLVNGTDGSTSSTNTTGAHTHNTAYADSAGGSGSNYRVSDSSQSGASTGGVLTTSNGDHSHNLLGNTGSGVSDGLTGSAHKNMQPYIVMRYIIKY